MDLHFIIMAIFWLGGGNLIVALSLKRQKLPLIYMLSPIVLSKVEARDWLRLFGLMILIFIAGIIWDQFLN